MADTLRKKLIALVETRLNNYTFTAFKKADDDSAVQPTVYKGRLIFDPDDDPLPLITLMPGVDDSVFNAKYKRNDKTFPVIISALTSIEDITETYDITENILGEMEEALFTDGALQLALGTPPVTYDFPFHYLGGGVADYPEELGSAIVAVGLSSQIIIESEVGDPYN